MALVKNMVRSSSTEQLWDDVLEFEAYLWSHTSLDVYMIQVGIPDTVMLGGTS